MANQSGPPSPSKGGTGKFERQGHTAGPFGNDPNKDAMGQSGQSPRDLKP